MTEKISLYKKTKTGLEKILPGFVFALLLAQPLLDIISYWADTWEFTAVTTLTRFAMFAAVMLYGFIVSDRKLIYIVTAAGLSLYWVLHMIACIRSAGGYESPVSDMNCFFRLVHMPLFTLVFITCFKKCNKIPQYVQKAFFINFVIMMHSVILSYMTDTKVYTYGVYGEGLMGWVVTHNAQSAVLALITPLLLLYVYKKKNLKLFYAVALVCLADLFFVGTKVDYFTIPIVAAVMIVTLIVSGEKKIGYYAVLAGITIVCLACFNTSIVSSNIETHTASMTTRQEAFEDKITDDDSPKQPDHIDAQTFSSMDVRTKKNIRDLYELYAGPMVQRFGFMRVFEKYNYSLVVSELAAQRQQKRYFAELVWEDSSTLTRLFGFEYSEMVEEYSYTDASGKTVTKLQVYDLENDFPAVFYFSGYAGFFMYMLFLLYFVLLILVAVVTRFKKVVNVESGMVGLTFALTLGISQFSGNVLLRPNASIYLSVILAYIYYLTAVKENVKLRDIFKVFSKNKSF